MLDLTGGDPFDHRNVDIGLSATKRRAVGLQEKACEADSTTACRARIWT